MNAAEMLILLGKKKKAAAFNPLSIAGMIGWYDFSDASTLKQASGGAAVAADGDPIGYVQDKSGAGHHYVQSTSAKKPTWKQNIQNGLSVARLDGVDDQWKLDPWSGLTAPVTFIAVASRITTSGVGALWGALPTARFDNAGRLSLNGGTFMQTATGVYAANTKYILSFVFNGGSSAIYLNGVSKISGAGGSTTVTFTALGSAYDANYLAGDLCEVYIYNSLSDANRQACEAGLNTKWAVA